MGVSRCENPRREREISSRGCESPTNASEESMKYKVELPTVYQ